MKRTLAPEALYSSERHRPEHGGSPDDIPAMQNLTKEQLEKIDPGGRRAKELIKKYARKPDEKKVRWEESQKATLFYFEVYFSTDLFPFLTPESWLMNLFSILPLFHRDKQGGA